MIGVTVYLSWSTFQARMVGAGAPGPPFDPGSPRSPLGPGGLGIDFPWFSPKCREVDFIGFVQEVMWMAMA
jgi:hypothetical protein